MLHKLIPAALVVVIAGSLGIGGTHASSAGSHSAASMPTLRWVNWVSPDLALAATLDPAQVSAAADYQVIKMTHAAVVWQLPTGKPQLQLATKYSVSKNGLTYEFTLRKAQFFNGDPITAQDVVYSIKRALRAPGSPVNYYDMAGYGDILGADDYANKKSNNLGVKALNSTTLQVKLSRPIAYFLNAFSYPINMPLDPKVVNGHSSGASGNYLTTNCPAARADASGQYTFQCSGSAFYPAGQTPKYTLVPNPKYFGHHPNLKQVIGVVGQNTTEYNQYLAGSLDLSVIPAQFLPQWKANPKGQLISGKACPKPTKGCPETSIYYLPVNTKAAPFDNANCRLALAYGLNRAQESKIYNGALVPAYTITPGGLGIMTPAAVKTIANKVPRYNLAKGKSYADKCPSKSTPFTYVYATGSTTATALALEQVKEMQDLGFTGATAKGLPTNEWLTDVNTPMSSTGISMVRGGWLQDYPDPQDYVSLLWGCTAQYNIGQYCNKKAQNLMDAADVNHNVSKRTQQYLQAQTLLLNQGSPIMLFNGAGYGLIKKYVHGLSWSVSDAAADPPNNDWSKVTIAKH